MPIHLMKIIDEYFGRVVISFILIFKKVFSKQNLHREISGKNILLIKFWGVGSIVLTTPALNKIRNAYPHSRIYFLTLGCNLEICNAITQIDNILTIRISNPFIFFMDFLKTILILRKQTFDYIFDFEFYTYFSAIIVSLIRPGFSVGFDNLKNKRGTLFSKTVLFNERAHTKDNFLSLTSVIPEHVKGNNIFPKLIPDDFYDRDGEMLIIINPNASKLAYERRLPKENFVEIIDYISNAFKCRIVLTGTKAEEEYVKEIYKLVIKKDKVYNLCGKTSIKELMLLIKTCTCLITVDSGPLHIASALNIPVIAFFGPESPDRYGPLSGENLVFYKNLKCSPCMSISNSKTVNCIYASPKCMEQFVMKDVNKSIHDFIMKVMTVKTNTAA